MHKVIVIFYSLYAKLPCVIFTIPSIWYRSSHPTFDVSSKTIPFKALNFSIELSFFTLPTTTSVTFLVHRQVQHHECPLVVERLSEWFPSYPHLYHSFNQLHIWFQKYNEKRRNGICRAFSTTSVSALTHHRLIMHACPANRAWRN